MPDEADVNIAVMKKVQNSDNIKSIVYVAKLKAADLAKGGVWLQGEYEGDITPDEEMENSL